MVPSLQHVLQPTKWLCGLGCGSGALLSQWLARPLLSRSYSPSASFQSLVREQSCACSTACFLFRLQGLGMASAFGQS